MAWDIGKASDGISDECGCSFMGRTGLYCKLPAMRADEVAEARQAGGRGSKASVFSATPCPVLKSAQDLTRAGLVKGHAVELYRVVDKACGGYGNGGGVYKAHRPVFKFLFLNRSAGEQ